MPLPKPHWLVSRKQRLPDVAADEYAEFAWWLRSWQTAYGVRFRLTSLLASPTVDCQDMSAVVELFTRVLGGSSVQVRRIDEDFFHKYILRIGKSTWTNGFWNFHQVGWYNGAVYDACLQLRESDPYVPVGDDIYGSYSNNLHQVGEWIPQEPHNITSFD